MTEKFVKRYTLIEIQTGLLSQSVLHTAQINELIQKILITYLIFIHNVALGARTDQKILR